MIKTNDLILGGAIASLGILGMYLLEKSKKNRKEEEEQPKGTSNFASYSQASNNTSGKQEKPTWKLSRGSKGKEVERLQIFLLRNHGWKGAITRVFDDQTERLVQKVFKKDHIDRTIYEKYQMAIPIHQQIQH